MRQHYGKRARREAQFRIRGSSDRDMLIECGMVVVLVIGEQCVQRRVRRMAEADILVFEGEEDPHLQGLVAVLRRESLRPVLYMVDRLTRRDVEKKEDLVVRRVNKIALF